MPNARHSKNAAPHVAGQGPDPDLLKDGLAALGIAVRVRRPNDFPLNPLARRGTFYAGFDPVRALRVLLFDRDVDVVVAVGESSIFFVLLLARLLRFKPRLLLREISARGWRIRDRVVDSVVSRVDRVLVLTPHQKAWAEATFHMKSPPDNVGFAIDESFYKPLDWPEDRTILAVGDDAGRDYECLIAACHDTPYKLILRTDTNPSIPAAQNDRVTLLGRLPYTDLRNLYAAASVVVVPLRPVDHPSGITALLEAMAMGRAVVASDIGSTRDVVQHGTNGILVPAGDPMALRTALISLMEDPAGRARLGQSARSTIDSYFSYGLYVRRFAASLLSVTAPADFHPDRP
jgi:glycosyltransferase involved in cell wall biosynthesis